MGTESKRPQNIIIRGKPPPIPPRPDHLLPVKNAAQYSSMPDILAGRRKDPNPDLLRLKKSDKDHSDKGGRTGTGDRSLDRKCFPPSNGKTVYVNMPGVEKMSTTKSVASTKSSSSSSSSTSGNSSKSSGVMKSFSCIPSRSNSKKKKSPLSAPAAVKQPKMRQTNWYVEEEGNPIACPSWQAALNSSAPVDFSYISEESIRSVLWSDRKILRPKIPMASSSSLSGLPPLPKSLSDASLTWDYVVKKLNNHQDQASPCSSRSSSNALSGLPPLPKSLSDASLTRDYEVKKLNNDQNQEASPCSSRSSSRAFVHPKVPPPPPPPSECSSTQGESPSIQPSAPPASDDDSNENNSSVSDLPAALDLKLAILRKEMCELRQMDLSLLNQLWSLNEAIHEFRQLQEALSLQTPSSEEDEGDEEEEEIQRLYSNVNVPANGTILAEQNSICASSTTSHHSDTLQSPPTQNLYTDL